MKINCYREVSKLALAFPFANMEFLMSKRVLIADDSATIQMMLRIILSEQGHKVIAVNNGLDAVRQAYKLNPDLIILDVDMPKMTGYQACRILKEDLATKHIPIIILTARDQQIDRFWGLMIGANDYQVKDLEQTNDLLASVEWLLAQPRHEDKEFEPQDLTDIEILGKVSTVLEHKLFQATIVNELSALVDNMTSFSDTVVGIMKLLSKVCSFCGAFFILRDTTHPYGALCSAWDETVPCIIEAYDRVSALARGHDLLVPARISDLQFIPCDKERGGNKNARVGTFESFLLTARDNQIGIMAVVSTRVNAWNHREMDTLRLFAREVSVVLDSALLFRDLQRTNKELLIMQDVSRQISSILDIQRLIDKIVHSVFEAFDYQAVSVYIVDDRIGELSFTAHVDSVVQSPETEDENTPKRLKSRPNCLIRHIAQERAAVNIPDARNDVRCETTLSNSLSVLAIPLIVGDKLIGIFDLESAALNAFSEQDVRLMSALANQIAVAIENARLYQAEITKQEQIKHDLQIAHNIQQDLFPKKKPTVANLDIDAICMPAQETSGDFYDFIELGDRYLGIVVADVLGKSIPAALLMATTRSSLRGEIMREGVPRDNEAWRGPANVLTRVNETLCQDIRSQMYVTLFYAIIDTQELQMYFANAGHISPILCSTPERLARLSHTRSTKTIGSVYLETDGLPLGITTALSDPYEQGRIPLSLGDTIAFYTDGIVEAMNARQQLFGFDRLESAIIKSNDNRASEVIHEVVSDVNDFVKDEERHDDLTLVVVRVLKPNADRAT